MIPGEYIIRKKAIILNRGKKIIKIKVSNKGDRPIQVGSHYHFAEVNSYLDFNRDKAIGMRLNIASGIAIRFEPGQISEIELIPYSGYKKIIGFNKKFMKTV